MRLEEDLARATAAAAALRIDMRAISDKADVTLESRMLKLQRDMEAMKEDLMGEEKGIAGANIKGLTTLASTLKAMDDRLVGLERSWMAKAEADASAIPREYASGGGGGGGGGGGKGPTLAKRLTSLERVMRTEIEARIKGEHGLETTITEVSNKERTRTQLALKTLDEARTRTEAAVTALQDEVQQQLHTMTATMNSKLDDLHRVHVAFTAAQEEALLDMSIRLDR